MCHGLPGVFALSGTAAIAETPANPDALQEIVVTAEKREGTVQNTPMSISAYSGAELLEAGIVDLEQVARQTPGIAFETTGPSRTQFSIRGMSSNGGAAPTVGFYLDDTPITPPIDSTQGKNFIDPDLYDLSRVEVLRGPQGTLYGASSMGGTIRLITNQPVLDRVEASAHATTSGTEDGGLNYSFSGLLNVPLINDVLAVRLIATEKHYDGYIDRIVPTAFPLPVGDTRGDVAAAPVAIRHDDVNNEDTQNVRVLVTLAPFAGLTITPSLYYQDVAQSGENSIDDPPGGLVQYQPFDQPEPFHDRFAITSLVVKYQLDNALITSSTAYTQRATHQSESESEPYLVLFSQPAGLNAYVPAYATETQQSKQLTEEARISSSGDQPLEWIGGVFFSRFNDTYFSGNQPIPAYGALYGDPLPLNYTEPDKLRQVAVFGEASYAFDNHVKATLGLRYLDYTDSYSLYQEGFLAPSGLASANGSASGNKVTPKISVDYTGFSNLLLYATAASGTRPGSANLPIPETGPLACGATPPATYRSDSIWSYEIGEKARVADGRVTVNGSLFYINWQDVQQQVYLACGYNYTDNLGTAVSKGGELELRAQLSSAVAFDQDVGYTHAVLTQTSAATGAVVGQQLQNVPKYTLSSSLEFKQPITSVLSLSARLTNSYISESFDRAVKPAYDLLSTRLGVHNQRYDLFLFGDNLTNRVAILANSTSLAVNIPELNREVINRPRTIGIDLDYRF